MKDTVDLVFDGNCGFCTRSALFIQKLDRKNRVLIHAAQKPGVHEKFNLSEADTNRAAWAILANKKFEGAGAVNLVIDTALGIKFFTPIYRLPLIRQIQDRTYEWVARNRHLFKGVTPWCEQQPQECQNS